MPLTVTAHRVYMGHAFMEHLAITLIAMCFLAELTATKVIL